MRRVLMSLVLALVACAASNAGPALANHLPEHERDAPLLASPSLVSSGFVEDEIGNPPKERSIQWADVATNAGNTCDLLLYGRSSPVREGDGWPFTSSSWPLRQIDFGGEILCDAARVDYLRVYLFTIDSDQAPLTATNGTGGGFRSAYREQSFMGAVEGERYYISMRFGINRSEPWLSYPAPCRQEFHDPNHRLYCRIDWLFEAE